MLAFTGSPQHFRFKGFGDPEAGVCAQGKEQGANLVDDADSPRFEQAAERACHMVTAEQGRFPSGEVVQNEQGVGMLLRKHKALGFAWMKAGQSIV